MATDQTPQSAHRWSTGTWTWTIMTAKAEAPRSGVDPGWDFGTVEYTKSIIAAEGSI